jgi:hypothetical protein
VSNDAARRLAGGGPWVRARQPVRRLTSGHRALPAFLLIGAQKSGTTTLYDLICQHPRVLPALTKEVHYFDLNWDRGQRWYRAHFPRRDELAAIDNPVLRRTAPDLDARLKAARFQTLVHGDAKDENFCFSTDHRVAAVDFQYVGYGPGIVDIAYLLYGRDDWSTALDAYCQLLPSEVASEWRALYPIAQRDFERFLVGWRR